MIIPQTFLSTLDSDSDSRYGQTAKRTFDGHFDNSDTCGTARSRSILAYTTFTNTPARLIVMRHASILLFALLRLTLAKDLAHTPTSRSTNDTALDARGIPLVDGIVHTATNLAAQLQVGACVRLGADFNFAAGTQNQEGVTEIKLKKNACICVDVNAYAGVLDASAGVDVVAQVKGQESVHLRGDVALTLARSVSPTTPLPCLGRY